jgi:hypothetical protein
MYKLSIYLVMLVFLAVVSKNSHSAEMLENTRVMAAKAYAAGEWQTATAAYQAVVEQEPNNQVAWFRLGRSLIELKQGQKAQQALEQALVVGAIPLPFVHVQLARAAMLQTGPEQANKQAIMWLSKAAESGLSNVSTLEQEPLFADLLKHSEFPLIAQKIDENARPCLYQAQYRQFDFWLGTWSVYGNPEKTGPLYGNNRITSEQNGCLLTENWLSASGGPGTSMNYYDGTEQKWVQHWVSAGGTVINMQGGLVAGAMVMQGKIYYVNTTLNPVRDFRARFSRLDKGIVRQFFEESIDAGQSWYPWFEGFYFPEPEAQ